FIARVVLRLGIRWIMKRSTTRWASNHV
ncbi:hypothetical protein CFC21_017334, partial [Triticum aestivum]